MPQPNSPHITSTPSVPAQPYSAEEGAVSTPPFKEVMAGPCDINTGRCSGQEWPGTDRWVQT